MVDGHGQVGRGILLDGADFKVARQLTFDIPNILQEPLREMGWNDDVEEFLKKLMRSVARDLDSDQEILLTRTDADTKTALNLNSELSGRGEYGSSAVITRFIPDSVADMWPGLLRAVWRELGPLEARYRTGYYEQEIEKALNSVDLGCNPE